MPGQASIIGVGRINDTCVPVGGNIMVHKIMNITLSVDHKVVNGAEAAQFLDAVKTGNKIKVFEDGTVEVEN